MTSLPRQSDACSGSAASSEEPKSEQALTLRLSNVDGRYFADAAEANDWLGFDVSDDEAEAVAFAEPDRFGEWQLWKAGAR